MLLIVFIATLMSSLTAFALPKTPSIYTDYRILEFGYSRLTLSSHDLFRLYYRGDEGGTRANLGGNYFIFNQNINNSWSIRENGRIDYSNSYRPESPNRISRNFQNNFGLSYSHYLSDYSGVHAFAEGRTSDRVSEYTGYENRGYDESNNYNYEAGVGYGRVLNTYPVFVALMLDGELDSDLSDKVIMQIAEIISRRNEYRNTFYDDFEMEYYKDLATKLGTPENAIKIRQILTNTRLYKKLDAVWAGM